MPTISFRKYRHIRSHFTHTKKMVDLRHFASQSVKSSYLGKPQSNQNLFLVVSGYKKCTNTNLKNDRKLHKIISASAKHQNKQPRGSLQKW